MAQYEVGYIIKYETDLKFWLRMSVLVFIMFK